MSLKYCAISATEWEGENSRLFIYPNLIQTQQNPAHCGGFPRCLIADVNTIRTSRKKSQSLKSSCMIFIS